MLSKMFLSVYLCKKVERTARAFAAHDDGAFEERGVWFKRVLKDFYQRGKVKEIYPHGKMCHDAVFLCHSDQVEGREGSMVKFEFEEFDCD